MSALRQAGADLRTLILAVSAVTGLSGLGWLAFGLPRRVMLRRTVWVALLVLPIATYSLYLVAFAQAPANEGGFWSPWVLGLLLLVPELLGWVAVCFLAYFIGHMVRHAKNQDWCATALFERPLLGMTLTGNRPLADVALRAYDRGNEAASVRVFPDRAGPPATLLQGC